MGVGGLIFQTAEGWAADGAGANCHSEESAGWRTTKNLKWAKGPNCRSFAPVASATFAQDDMPGAFFGNPGGFTAG
jgi:hypothetical protein